MQGIELSNEESSHLEAIVSEQFEGLRIDVAIVKLFQDSYLQSQGHALTRTQVKYLLEDGFVSVNKKRIQKASYEVHMGEHIEMLVPPIEPLELFPDSSVPLNIVFEDEEILIINKQVGLVVHPGAGNKEKTLLHGLLAHLGDKIQLGGEKERPGLVHRIDKDTSGLLAIAKTTNCFQSLTSQLLPPRTMKRQYLALIHKLPKGMKDERGTINLPIARHPQDRKKMAIVENGKQAITHYQVNEHHKHGAELRIQLETGRTHQIRVHLQAVQAPILGDQVYGPPLGSIPPVIRKACEKLGHQALHAESLAFIHPRTKKEVHFQVSPPEDYTLLKRALDT